MKKVFIALLLIILSLSLLLLFNLKTLLAAGRCSGNLSALLTDDCLDLLDRSQPTIKDLNKLLRSSTIDHALSLYDSLKPLRPFKDYLLGNSSDGTSYLILLQNNYELRANGGFFGTYAVLDIKDGRITTRFEDIYTPDGQLPGHVDPPAPIQEAFQTGAFRLRDSDYSPDFKIAASTIRWFMEKGNEISPDIMATLNFDIIRQIVNLTGPLEIPEYHTTVDETNLYNLLQTKSEVGFFPGSTQKKDIVSATGRALFQKIIGLSPAKQLLLAELLLTEVKNKNILINSKDSSFQQLLDSSGYSGVWKPADCQTDRCLSDTFGVIELNVGANKANCCTNKRTKHTIKRLSNSVEHSITIDYNNASSSENPIPPEFYGGNYIDYIRLYLPTDAANVVIKTTVTLPTTLKRYPTPFDSQLGTGSVTNTQNYGFTEIGFFHITRAQSQSSINITYTLPITGQTDYQLDLPKQHGVSSSPQVIDLFGTILTTELESDFRHVSMIE